ncbi:MAG: hypothetical protein LBJ04_22560 [Sphingobacterium sp.]|jgi:hypothetical protein|nr:hypothetical protein [Sphingobacterium sp.]
MRFAKLTQDVLRELKDKGFNVLIAPSDSEESGNVTWKAIAVPNVMDWLVALDCEGWTNIPFKEPNIWVIQDVLDNADEAHLYGSVFIEE